MLQIEYLVMLLVFVCPKRQMVIKVFITQALNVV